MLTLAFNFACGEHRYKILVAQQIKDDTAPEKAAKIILDHVGLESDQFRLGHTKVLFNSALWKKDLQTILISHVDLKLTPLPLFPYQSLNAPKPKN